MVTRPVLISWHYGKYTFFGDFRALKNYTKADRYPIPKIPNAVDKLEKAKYITNMDFIEGFHQNGVEPNSIKNAPAHFQTMMDTIFQEEILEGCMVVYIYDIIIYSESLEDHVQYIERFLSKCTPINLKVLLKKFNFGQQGLLALGIKSESLAWT
ncbi:hypothetical protein O181_005413 [Austropuccinia psidii MF-1]|uniref:Reverse transcriptase domain-containing protein n=1 Tax=Austropuccinia psidii MF-1 TaxID=1389203 RepID=A0A9Q3GFI2_9BASI|nr:hypothetical protein [Austropuccinia psidii MF-1]